MRVLCHTPCVAISGNRWLVLVAVQAFCFSVGTGCGDDAQDPPVASRADTGEAADGRVRSADVARSLQNAVDAKTRCRPPRNAAYRCFVRHKGQGTGLVEDVYDVALRDDGCWTAKVVPEGRTSDGLPFHADPPARGFRAVHGCLE